MYSSLWRKFEEKFYFTSLQAELSERILLVALLGGEKNFQLCQLNWRRLSFHFSVICKIIYSVISAEVDENEIKKHFSIQRAWNFCRFPREVLNQQADAHYFSLSKSIFLVFINSQIFMEFSWAFFFCWFARSCFKKSLI